MTMGIVGPPSFFDRSRTRDVPRSGAFDDAVTALHQLGERHGIKGILLYPPSSTPGGMMFTSADGHYLTGAPENRAVGEAGLRAIDDAARAVLQLALKA